MMNKKGCRRFLAVLCLAALLCGAHAPALAQGLVLMGLEDASLNRDWASNRFFARTAEKTGLAFSFRQYVEEEDYRAALEALEAGQELPDGLFKAALSPGEAQALLEKGVLMDLAP